MVAISAQVGFEQLLHSFTRQVQCGAEILLGYAEDFGGLGVLELLVNDHDQNFPLARWERGDQARDEFSQFGVLRGDRGVGRFLVEEIPGESLTPGYVRN